MQINYKAKLITSTLIIFYAIWYSTNSYAQITMLDRVVAQVNNIAVTQTELDSRMEEVAMRSQASGVTLPDADVLKNQVLDQLIAESLQLDLAKRYDVVIPDTEVNDSVARVITNNRLTELQFLEQLKKDGVTYNEFRENIRRQLTLRTITEGIVSRRIRISEQEIDNFLKSADARFWAKPDYRIGHILIALPSSPSSDDIAQAEEKAARLYETAASGSNFANLAIAESNGQMALEGGDLGWRKPSELPTLFADALDILKPGDVSQPLRSQAGLHIIKLYEARGEQKQIVKQNNSRHILIKNSEILDDNQAQEKLRSLRTRILNGENFNELAKEFSEDIGTRLQGGELGWASPGMFVPAFEKAITETPIKEISQPFKSRFGWHILQVLEMREEDMTQTALRAKAKNIILGRRFEDETQIWLQELRDEAFIKISI